MDCLTKQSPYSTLEYKWAPQLGAQKAMVLR